MRESSAQDVARRLRELLREAADEGARGPEAWEVERALGLRRSGVSGRMLDAEGVERLAGMLEAGA